MNEYMFLIRNQNGCKEGFTPEKHLEFVNACKTYINSLEQESRLIAAQPLIREGQIISLSDGQWAMAPFNETNEVQVGYYHVRAKDMEEAIELAKGNPEFVYTTTARIEIRPVKIMEQSNEFVYPKAG